MHDHLLNSREAARDLYAIRVLEPDRHVADFEQRGAGREAIDLRIGAGDESLRVRAAEPHPG